MKSEIIIRTVLLCAVLALSIATAASCLNVLRKRDEEIEHARESASKLGIVIDINTDELDHPGEALAAACFFAFLMSLIYLFIQPLTIWLRRRRSTVTASSHYAPWGWFVVMPVATIFLLGTAIATQLVAKSKSAKISATLAGAALPQSLIEQRAKNLGINPKYWTKDYVRQMAILAWPTFAVTLLLTLYTAYTVMKHRKASRITAQDPVAPVHSRDSVEPKVSTGV